MQREQIRRDVEELFVTDHTRQDLFSDIADYFIAEQRKLLDDIKTQSIENVNFAKVIPVRVIDQKLKELAEQ